MAQPPPESALVAQGFSSAVYAWDEGRVLKLFFDWFPRERAQREFRATRAVHAIGLPVPQAEELVEVGGRSGIVSERVNGLSMLGVTQRRPWMLMKAVRQLAELHAQIHEATAPAILPTQRQRLERGITSGVDLKPAERLEALSQLSSLPDGNALCHGDFHPGNVIFTANGPIIIDWETATQGDPIGDVANTCRLIRTASLPDWSPAYMHWILKCTRPWIHRTYLRRYFELRAGSAADLVEWELPLRAAAKSWRVAQ